MNVTPGSKIVFEKNGGKEIRVVKFYTWIYWTNIYRFLWIVNLFLFSGLWSGMFVAFNSLQNGNINLNTLISIAIPVILLGIASFAYLVGGITFIRFTRRYKKRKTVEILINYKGGWKLIDDRKSRIILTQYLSVPYIEK